jgi:hypothetical protein
MNIMNMERDMDKDMDMAMVKDMDMDTDVATDMDTDMNLDMYARPSGIRKVRYQNKQTIDAETGPVTE